VGTTVIHEPSVEKQERRKNKRYTMSLPVTIRAGGEQSVNATSRDVSSGGVYIFFEAPDNLQAGAELDITLALPKEIVGDVEVLVRARGKAVRVDSVEGNGTGTGVAVAFETHHFVRANSRSN
jgi:c-di-GMP-binding flagellar brake protein YcgR